MSWIGFVAPLALLALLALPLLWWLLRATPPAPRRYDFPALQFLKNKEDEETPSRLPWWLFILRLFVAICLILGLAGPILFPRNTENYPRGSLLLIDDGWAGAQNWQNRRKKIDLFLADLDPDLQFHLLFGASDQTKFETFSSGNGSGASHSQQPAGEKFETYFPLQPIRKIRQRLAQHQPVAWHPERSPIATMLTAQLHPSDPANPEAIKDLIWFSDGLDYGQSDAFLQQIEGAFNNAHIFNASANEEPIIAIKDATIESRGLRVLLLRLSSAPAFDTHFKPRTLVILDEKKHLLASGMVETELFSNNPAELLIPMPLDLANHVLSVKLQQAKSSAEHFLLGSDARRARVGIVETSREAQLRPLLSETRYLAKAIAPFAEGQQGSLSQLLANEPDIILMPDATLKFELFRQKLLDWMSKGGMLIRFAGPKLLREKSAFVPLPLRFNQRALGGSLSWEQPKSLAPFKPTSPLVGLRPDPEIRVSRQVLAQPSADLQQHSWAQLSDGVPLITAKKQGKGWFILIHVTAGPDWSNLPLTVSFSQILERLIRLGGLASARSSSETDAGTKSKAQSATEMLPIYRQLSAQGQLQLPSETQASLKLSQLAATKNSASTPAGIYGSENRFFAINSMQDLNPTSLSSHLEIKTVQTHSRNLSGLFWLIALGLLLLDLILTLWILGIVKLPPKLRLIGRGSAAAIAYLIILPMGLFLFSIDTAQAQSVTNPKKDDPKLQSSIGLQSNQLQLAYIRTGEAQLDELARNGLQGVAHVLNARTTVEPDAPLEIDLRTDPIAHLPFLYWLLPKNPAPLSESDALKLSHFINHGGVLFIDTNDADDPAAALRPPSQRPVARLLAPVELPPVEPMPETHVLRRAFYLLDKFPARATETKLWVESSNSEDLARNHDGVASVIIGNGNWAAAWSIDDQGRALASIEGGVRERELALHFGVNLVMHVLTGSYKTDQVHASALLERLGR